MIVYGGFPLAPKIVNALLSSSSTPQKSTYLVALGKTTSLDGMMNMKCYALLLNAWTTTMTQRRLEALNNQRRDRWIHFVENIDFKHSSRKVWSLLRKLESNT